MRFNKLLTYLLLLFASAHALSQPQYLYISKAEGLPHNSVFSIFKDSEGFIWLGTKNGLCRYDGFDLKVYRNSVSSTSLSGNRVLSINEDQQGYLWVGTHQNGLNRFDRKKGIFTHFNDPALGSQINNIRILKDGTIGICSNRGLALYDLKKNTFRIFAKSGKSLSINSNDVFDLVETSRGEIYVATSSDGIQKFDPEKETFTTINLNTDAVINNYRKRIVEDSKGNLWIVALKHDLCRYNPVSGQTKNFNITASFIGNNIVINDMLLADEKLYLAADNIGVITFDIKSETFDLLNFKKGILDDAKNHIYTLFWDAKNLWLGLNNAGAIAYNPTNNVFNNDYIKPEIKAFFESKAVISVFQDSKERIWIGTDGYGLHMIDKNQKLVSYYSNKSDPKSISSNVVRSIGEDNLGNILLGLYTGGFNILNPEKHAVIKYNKNTGNPEALHASSVWRIIKDSRDNIWLGLLGGGAAIFNSEKGTFTDIGPDATGNVSVNSPNVLSIMEDSDGDIWIGTEGGGIYVFDKQINKITQPLFGLNNGILNKGIVTTFFQDKNGDIWIGTEGKGVFRFSKISRTLQQFTTDDGLPSMIVTGIQQDKSGIFWLATYYGLCKFNLENKSVINYFASDGLSSNEFKSDAFIQLNNGFFLAGTQKGIDIFNPAQSFSDSAKPKVFFTKLLLLNKEINPGDTINGRIVLQNDITFSSKIKIYPADKIFSLEFAALNSSFNNKFLYRYKLEGFDKQWTTVDPEHRYATYSNLNNGEYIFKVQASDNDGVWNDNYTQLKIIVLPPFYKTWWFTSLIAMIIAIVLYAFYSFRIKQVQHVHSKERIEDEKRIIELEKRNIESELEQLSFYTANRNKTLVEYRNDLNLISNKANDAVKDEIQKLIKKIDEEISDDKEWVSMEPQIDKLYNGFISKLRQQHPDLTLSEIKVATYVRMDLSSKEIASFMNKTVRAVESERYRLRKKMGLEPNDSLQQYLLNI